MRINKTYVYLYGINEVIKINDMKNTITIKTELKKRTDLVNDMSFREICAKHSEAIGITAKEWNENKAMIIMKFANDFCAFENSKHN